MKKVTFLQKGRVHNFIRFGDCVRTVYISRTFESGGLLYGYTDRFNVISISKEDIISIEDI